MENETWGTRCSCGQQFDSVVQLRQHIAIITPRWPARRCTWDHHDPKNHSDVEYVIRSQRETTK